MNRKRATRSKGAKPFGPDPRLHLAAIVDSADDPIISKDLNGIVTTWNKAAERVFGYTAEEMVGQSILRLIPPELQHEEDEILRKLRSGERIEHYETIRQRKNGQQFPVSVTISPIKNGKGEFVGASKIARDISDRKRFEELLMQQEKLAATGRMAATIAHEINNPLESVMNLIYLARTNSSRQEPVCQYLKTAEAELERVSHIARQTLGFYKESGGPAKISITGLIEETLDLYHTKLMTVRIVIDCRFEPTQPILVNKGELLQVFSNIIANAIQAMPQGGRLSVQTNNDSRSANPGVHVSFRDTGCGIEKEKLPHVFDAFFTTKGELGTGIGLWVTKQLVEKHGGSIKISSSTDQSESGTTVEIFLPYFSLQGASGLNPEG